MSEHVAEVFWTKIDHKYQADTYSRDFEVRIGSDITIPASAATEYLGTADRADPEQLLVSALASCHMLYFLAICEGQGYVVNKYTDVAKGLVSKHDSGGYWVSEVVLKPTVEFATNKQPDQAALKRLHNRAHKGCFIANSIKTLVSIELN